MVINWLKLRHPRTKILFNALLDDELTKISDSKGEENNNSTNKTHLNTVNNYNLKEFNKAILGVSNTLLIEGKGEEKDGTYTTSLF